MGKATLIILSVIFFISAVLLFYFGFYTVTEIIDDRVSDVDDIRDDEKPIWGGGISGAASSVGTDGNGGGSSSSSGGSSGSAQGGSASASSGDGCSSQQISFSASNFYENSVCNEQDSNGFCIDRTITCLVSIANLDDEVGGNFGLSFRFFEEESNNLFYSVFSEVYLDPYEFNVFEEFFNVQSQGQEGDANKDITCFYFIENVPKKEICL